MASVDFGQQQMNDMAANTIKYIDLMHSRRGYIDHIQNETMKRKVQDILTEYVLALVSENKNVPGFESKQQMKDSYAAKFNHLIDTVGEMCSRRTCFQTTVKMCETCCSIFYCSDGHLTEDLDYHATICDEAKRNLSEKKAAPAPAKA